MYSTTSNTEIITVVVILYAKTSKKKKIYIYIYTHSCRKLQKVICAITHSSVELRCVHRSPLDDPSSEVTSGSKSKEATEK